MNARVQIERKNDDAPPLDLAKEIKRLISEQGTAFQQFKAANDEQLTQLKKDGAVAAGLADKVERINTDMTRLSSELDELAKKAAQRLAAAEEESGLTPEQQEYKSAFFNWLCKGEGVEQLRTLQKKAFREGSDPDGGFFLPTDFEAGIDRLVRKSGGLAALATTVHGDAANYKRFVKVSGGAARWVNETTKRQESGTGKFEQLSYVAGKLMAEPMLFADAMEDRSIVDLQAELQLEIAEAFEDMESDAFANGDGVEKPRGLYTYDTVLNNQWGWGKIGFVKSGDANTFLAAAPADALIDLVHALPAKMRGNARFLMNDTTLASVRKFKDGTTGEYLWQPGLQFGQPSLLLGYAVELDDYAPDVAANKFPIAFGDFARAYLVYRKRGLTARPVQYSKDYDAYQFPTVAKVGGGIRHYQAVKFLKISN